MTRPLYFRPSAEEITKALNEASEKIDDPIERFNYRMNYLDKLFVELEELEASCKKHRRAAKEKLERQKMQEARERVAVADLLEKAQAAWIKRWLEEKQIGPKSNIQKMYKMGNSIVS
ncbi:MULTISPECIES: hypothetical protein [unclassified Prochlorococcus]|uniref:hypothetical protein n=1 Tax=unclassified Prochlorococcus TaxID=2627481 RepID=UPI0005338813|nr:MULTISPECIES: hypothetical protein [unclassified Prochlorococcus]KGG14829.1 hypothetical protein EV06_1892 [Prochlorococcus sp. MIT 0602]KGG15738.1 hypothetical protein EV07_1703 [Prochlorococcus sp. MIT 0603]